MSTKHSTSQREQDSSRPNLSDGKPRPSCGVCGRPIYFREPDPSTCGGCVVELMGGLRRLRNRKSGPAIHPSGTEGTREAPAPSGVSSFPPPYSSRAAGAAPQARPGASAASKASRAAGDGSRADTRPNDASSADTITLEWGDE